MGMRPSLSSWLRTGLVAVVPVLGPALVGCGDPDDVWPSLGAVAG